MYFTTNTQGGPTSKTTFIWILTAQVLKSPEAPINLYFGTDQKINWQINK